MGVRGNGGNEGRNNDGRDDSRWLAVPANHAEVALREALDQAAAREVDEVALRRVWARVADLPDQDPLAMAADAVREAAGGESALRVEAERRARWPWIVAASLAGATAALAFMLVQTQVQTHGQAQNRLQPNAGPVAATVNNTDADATLGSSVVAPATVRTGAGETLHLTLRGGTKVLVQSESALVLDDKDRPSVSTGEVQFTVPKQAPGHTFEVSARDYRVVVVGTRFSVRVDRDRTAVGVTEGVVEVWTDHRIARLAAGESWSAAQPEAAKASAVPATVPAAPAASNNPASSNKIRSFKMTRASRTVGGTARATLAMATPSQSASAPAATGTPAGSIVSSVSAPLTTTSTAPAQPAVASSSPAPAPANDPVAAAPVPPTTAPAAVETPLAMQARAARAAGDSRRALGLYRTLAQRGGAAGENAEYEMGRILRDGLHQPREALAVWRGYRTSHPRGLLRVETDISVIETLIALGDKSGALAEANDFVHRYPESERRTEVARLAGDLLREGGDCAAAIDAYDTALSGRVRRGMADGVTFHRAVCVQRRDRVAGTAALKTYLQSFPSGRFRTDAQKLLSQSP